MPWPQALRHSTCSQEILDSLAELYSLLQEEDMWAGLWQKRCKYSETATAIAYEQHGFFEQVGLSTSHCQSLPPFADLMRHLIFTLWY